MGRFCGMIGFLSTDENPDRPFIHSPAFVEKKYYGDFLSKGWKTDNGDGANDKLKLETRVSVIANSFMKQNLGYMKYVIIDGFKWSISSVELQHPRVIFTVGGLYNDETV